MPRAARAATAGLRIARNTKAADERRRPTARRATPARPADDGDRPDHGTPARLEPARLEEPSQARRRGDDVGRVPRRRRPRTNAPAASTMHASIARIETTNAMFTLRCGRPVERDRRRPARRVGPHEPAVREPVDEGRRAEIVAVGLRFPPAVEALTEHEPVGLRSRGRPATSSTFATASRRAPAARRRRRRRSRSTRQARPRRRAPTRARGVRRRRRSASRGSRRWRSRAYRPTASAWSPWHGRSASGLPARASAVVPGDPHRQRLAVDRHAGRRCSDRGAAAGIGARCTPGMPSSAIAVGSAMPSG